MKKPEITGIIIAKNASKTIRNAVLSLTCCTDVIVADDGSTDETADEAKKAGATVIQLPADLSFAEKRMKAMQNTQHEWVLFLDADETLTPELNTEIAKTWPEKKVNLVGYYLRRRDFFWGKELRYGETLKARNYGICRLMHKKEGRWIGSVHETWVPNGNTVRLENFINHHPHPTLKEFIRDINDYSSRRARELADAKKPVHEYDFILYPGLKFFLTYILYLGFLDGAAGFAYSFLMSFHSFLVRAKLYQYTKLNKEIV